MLRNSFLLLKDESNPEKLYRLRTEWCDATCNIQILTEAGAYVGSYHITEERIGMEMDAFGLSLDKYIEKLKESLHPDRNRDEFSYQMMGDTFVIKKRLQETKHIKVRLANIKLEQTDLQKLMFEMFDEAMKEMEDLTGEIENLKKEKGSILRNYEIALERLDEMADTKIRSEEMQSKRFLCVLNTKKEKIARLEGKPTNTSDNEEMEFSEMDQDLSDDSAYSLNTNVDEEEMRDESPLPESQISQDDQIEETSKEMRIESVRTNTNEPIKQIESVKTDEPKKQIESVKANEPSNIEKYLDTMKFLDPTVPFEKR